MAENQKGTFLLKDKDFVEVVDAEGNDLPPVPKHWSDAELAPGAKKKSKSSSTSSRSSGGSTPPKRKKGEEPSGNASAEEWATFARESGAKDEDLVDEQGEPLKRDELRTKYGTSAS